LLFRRLFFSLAPTSCALQFIHSEAVLALLEGPDGKKINLPGGIIAVKRDQALWIGPATAANERPEKNGGDWTAVLVVPGKTVLPANLGTIESKWLTRNELPLSWEDVSPFEFYLDADRVSFPLTVRPRRSGDRLALLGLNGSKKVKDVLIDAKISPDQRGAYPILVDREGCLLGVIGLRPSRQGMVSPQTESVLFIHYRRETM
jgi:tRNA(Ile)-lysidine synthase